ncbi:glycoside hydrolase family 5 protein [Stipitochalara longipes BDJ]|nr:glycoside hydrolase family 5 protein [Stipitochalara longipes BDJ]
MIGLRLELIPIPNGKRGTGTGEKSGNARLIYIFLASIVRVAIAVPTPSYVNWTTFKASGVNLGGWLEQEDTIDSAFWAQYGGNTTDEWGLCARLGSQCGPVLERRYATFITPSDIDTLAAAGVTILRIPTTYAAWVKVPGSQLYSGNQVSFLKTIATYAIAKYNMHIIIDVHSLPGGVNGMGFGEANGHYGWFNNATALTYSYEAIDAVIAYVQGSGFPQSYTIEPINEPVDNIEITSFGTPAALSDNGAAWVLKYIQGVIAKVQAVNAKIPVMFQGSFKGEAYWSPNFPARTNLVFDVHNYYFAGRPTDSTNVSSVICSDAKASAGDGKFPVFVGEWSIQTVADNLFSTRAKNLNTGLYAFAKYDHGSAYWTAKFSGDTAVAGQGMQSDYWSYEDFISLGYIDPASGAANCP